MAQRPPIDPVSVDAQFNPNPSLPLETPDLDPSKCPKTHHLIITTTKAVYSWNGNAITELFRSDSQPIVAAKRAPDGSGVLAVADSQGVTLHDGTKGTERSYRLKGLEVWSDAVRSGRQLADREQGHVSLLKYASDGRNLFFTTSLQNSVQTYSSRQYRLLDPWQTHPTPPTVLALSFTSHLLLSASVEPPTILLTNLTLRTAPISLRPSCSSSSVVAAAFHPERPNLFVLAFADGCLAIYDAVQVFRNGGKGERKDVPAGNGKSGELGRIKGLHTAGAISTPSDPDALLAAASLSGYNEDTETVAVGSRATGITAVSFLPGYPARAISAGADGKCHLIDFEAHIRKESRVVASWHVRGPATSLSVVPLQERGSTTPKRRNTSRRKESSGNVSDRSLIVVGRLDGKVCLFSDSGSLRGEMQVDPTGGPILDVEWMEGSEDQVPTLHHGPCPASQSSKPRPKPVSHGSTTRTSTAKAKRNSVAKSKRGSLGSLLAAGRQAKEEVVIVEGEEDKTADFDWRDAADVYAAKYMDMFSPVKQPRVNESSDVDRLLTTETQSPTTLLEQLSAVELQFPLSGLEPTKPNPKVARRDPRAAVRPRPGPRRGSQAAMRASQTTRRACQDDGKVIADIRRTALPGRPAKGFALFAPYMERKVMVGGTASVKLRRSNTQTSTTSQGKTADRPGEDVWTDVVNSPLIPAPIYSQKAFKDVSRKVGRNVSFQPSSVREDSDDTTMQGHPHSRSLISDLELELAQDQNRNNHAEELTRHNDTIVHLFSKEESAHGFKIHEDSSQLSNTIRASRQTFSATQAEINLATPLEETSHNLGSTTSSNNLSKLPGKIMKRANSQSDIAAYFHEKLQDAKTALADDMRSFQAEMLREFEQHKKKVEDALTRESMARQKLVEENRLLRAELSRATRRRC